jgi:hypothetical protein
MKQFTSIEQTAKLIELGFEKPKTKVLFEVGNNELGYTYSIGELIEMLPRRINGHNGIIDLYRNSIDYNTSDDILSLHQRGEFYLRCAQGELIDTIYEVLVKLKEEGVI